MSVKWSFLQGHVKMCRFKPKWSEIGILKDEIKALRENIEAERAHLVWGTQHAEVSKNL